MISSIRPEKLRTRGANSRTRILIVDEEPLIRWALTCALRGAGFDPTAASCGADALVLARAAPPEALLIDCRLYDMDPVALIDVIRGLSPECRVFALTTGQLRAGSRSPVLATTIRKPFDVAQVVRIVEATLTEPV